VARPTLFAAVAVLAAVLVPHASAAADPPSVGDVTVVDTDQSVAFVDSAVIGPDGAWWGIRHDHRIMRVDADDDVQLFDMPLATDDGTQLVVGPDDVLWVWPARGDSYARVAMDGTVTVHPDPVLDPAIAAVTHPDGTIWVLTTEEVVRVGTDGSVAGTIALDNGGGLQSVLELTPGGDVLTIVAHSATPSDLVRVAPNGDVTSTPLTGLDDPSELVVQPDGDVFVASSSPSVVAEVTPGGPEPVDHDGWPSSIRDLDLGADGAVWVQGLMEVARIDDDGEVISVDLPDGIEIVGTLSLGTDDRMWVSDFGRLHRIADDGSFTTQRIGVGEPFTGTAGPDGSPWLGGHLDGHVGRIDGDGELEVVADVGETVAYGITTGPDGNVWVTDGGLVRVTPGGDTTRFPLPGVTNAWDVTTGDDGNLWVIDQEGAVARVGTDGTSTVFPMPDGFDTPFRIVTGGDGNVWINELDGKDVARVGPEGTIDVFAVPATGAVTNLATDPDGAVWATHDVHSVLRISPTGITTSTPTPDFITMTLTAGPDGNLWLAGLDPDGGAVARLSPDGALTTWPADVGRAVEAFTTPDGYVWVPNGCCFGPQDNSVLRVAAAQVDVELTVAEDEVTIGDDVQVSVRIENTGPTPLTGIEVDSQDVVGCAGSLDDLAPGEEHVVDCTTAAGQEPADVELDATVDTVETQPETASDTFRVDPRPRCLGLEVTVDLGRDEVPTPGADVVLGTPAADTIDTGDGDDVVCAGAGQDVIHGGRGDDRLVGGDDRDTIDGGSGDDVLRGLDQPDQVAGGRGFDLVDGGDGQDTVRGGPQADRLLGGANHDRCDGQAGVDRAASCEVLAGVP
jgi:virginiamycin B lyase